MTEVKIYREQENESLIINEDDLNEYHNLVEELGLQVPQEEKRVPNVYMCLNSSMKKQLENVCNCHSSVENYKRTTVPLEILRVYKFAKENEMFHGFEIWCDDKKPDPLLIGWKYDSEEAREKKQSWSRTFYLITRWGVCALELPELLQLGFERIKQMLVDQATEAITNCNNIIASPDIYTRKCISGNLPSIYISI